MGRHRTRLRRCCDTIELRLSWSRQPPIRGRNIKVRLDFDTSTGFARGDEARMSKTNHAKRSSAPGFEIKGGCQCGAVRYSVHAPAQEMYHCHCSICRKSHGTLFATYATVPREHLRIDHGAANLVTYSSSPDVHRHFCGTCGCQLLLDDDRWPDLKWFTPGTLDGGEHPGHPAATERHIFVGSKVPWHEITDSLPRHEEFSVPPLPGAPVD